VLLFRQYNYMRSALAQLKEQVNLKRYVPAALLDEIELHLVGARMIPALLVASHLSLAVDVARKHVGRLVRLPELLTEACLCLRRVIDRFDHRRGGRLAHLARLELMKNFARTIPPANYELRRPPGVRQGAQGADAGGLLPQQERLAALGALASCFAAIQPQVPERLRSTLLARFGLRQTPIAEALSPVATDLGLGGDAALVAAGGRSAGSGPVRP